MHHVTDETRMHFWVPGQGLVVRGVKDDWPENVPCVDTACNSYPARYGFIIDGRWVAVRRDRLPIEFIATLKLLGIEP